MREKLACQVEFSVAKGLATTPLSQKQSAHKLADDMQIIAEEYAAMEFPALVLQKSEMVQIDLDYSLIAG